MPKYKMLTHTDLDGVGCAILARLYLKDVDVQYCSNSSIDERVKEFVVDHEADVTHLLITDVSIEEEVATLVDQLDGVKVVLLDHHHTGLALNHYDWATVKVETDGFKHCGTELFYHYLCDILHPTPNVVHEEFVEFVRLYDVWEWEEKGALKAGQLSDLLQFEGLYRFCDGMVHKLARGKLFTKEDVRLLEILHEAKESYIRRKLKQVEKLEVDGYQVGLVFGEQHISELGNELAKEHPDVDIIGIFTGRKVSLRSVKDTIHLGEWSQTNYDGGGHKLAAGMGVSDEKLVRIAQIIFEKEVDESTS
ncbi:MAG: DHH family phosphoesterase [Cellulosilyticaceae bacterium]